MLKKLLFLGAPLLIVLTFVGSFFWSARQPPEFYQEALRDVPPPEVREQVVKQLVEQTRQLVNDLEHAPRWSEEFTEEQINSWLAQEFEDAEIPWLPKGVHEPRVKLHDSLLKLAFRLQNSRIRGVVSCELQPWINGANQLTIGVRNVRLGLVPIPLEHLMQELQGQTALDGWRVSWRRTGGQGTVVLNLDQGQPVQPILETLQITEGALAVAGRRGPLSAAEPDGRLSLRVAPRPDARHATVLGWLPSRVTP